MAMTRLAAAVIAVACAVQLTAAHSSIWHPSMWGFNVTDHTFPYDNRPVTPLTQYTFDKWWFHGHLDYPPHDGDFFELPAGKSANAEIACDKGLTSYFASSQGGDARSKDQPNSPCPGSDTSAFHTTGIDDVKGCALAITYKSDVKQVQPEDFTVFSVNQTCVWNLNTGFQVPEQMPECPEGGCICAFFWIHAADSGGEQNYMNGFRCKVTGASGKAPIAKAEVPRRCGKDPNSLDTRSRTLVDTPGNCTWGAKQPFYWFQAERNNMFEGTYSPPFYLDLYNFKDGAQSDIFEGYYKSIPKPGPNQTELPVLANGQSLQISGSTNGGNSSTSKPGGDGASPDPTQNQKRCSSGSGGAQNAGNQRRSLLNLHRSSRTLNMHKRSTIWMPI